MVFLLPAGLAGLPFVVSPWFPRGRATVRLRCFAV